MPKKQWSAVRRNTDGSVDDVAISGDLFRLEQMDDDSFWACVYRGDKAIHFIIRGKKLTAQSYGDDIGCIDDTSEAQDG